MNYRDLLQKDLATVSSDIRNLSSYEMDQFQNAVIDMGSVFRCRFARLVVYRNDSLRLLSLLDSGDLELCRCCMRYLKIHSIRKDLLSKLTSVEEFCRLYNSCCDFGRNALLETLVWNKKRDESCLANQLVVSNTLQLNAYQESLLVSACSIDKLMTMQLKKFSMKKYFKLNRKRFEQIAVEKLYELYQQRESVEDLLPKCNSLVPFVYNPYSLYTINGKSVRTIELILDLWLHLKTPHIVFNSYVSAIPKQSNCIDIGTTSLQKDSMSIHFTAMSLDSMVTNFIKRAPVYCLHRLDIINLYNKSVGSFTFKYESLLCLYQNARAVGDEEMILFVVKLLSDYRNLVSSSDFTQTTHFHMIKQVLLPEHFTLFIETLQDVILQKLKSIPPTQSITWSPLPCTVSFLLSELTIESPKNLEIVNLLSAFEKQYIDRAIENIYDFYGLQNQLVDLDFPYQLAPKNNPYKTCRKWESILCLKGNSYLNSFFMSV